METKTIDAYLDTENNFPENKYFKEMKNMVEVFHQNTKQSPAMGPLLQRSIINHLYGSKQIFLDSKNKKNYFLKPIIQLPKRNVFSGSFENIVNKRKSNRNFKNNPLSDQELSNLLSSLRITRKSHSSINEKAEINLRTYASAGGLYPIETYVLRPNIDYDHWEVSHYAILNHTLSVINENVPLETMQNAIQNFDQQAKNAGAIIVLTGVFERSLHKYGAMGYRFALLEAGGMLQQLALGTASIGLGGVAWGGAYDDKINNILEIDGVDESLLTCFLVGKIKEPVKK